MIRFTETVISRAVRGTFFGRTCSRGEGVDSFLEGEGGRVGDLVLNETRLVLPFKLPWDESVLTPRAGLVIVGCRLLRSADNP
jgi:hypothetical protein